MSKTGLRFGLAMIVMGLMGLGISRMRSASSIPAPDYGHVPEFSLTERSGRNVTLGDLRGQVWIADFIFTSCAGSCPIMSSQMQRLQGTLPHDIHFVSFSVDPARDTPLVLAQYAEKYSADSQRWMFLTGDRKAIYDITMKGFKLALDDSQGSDLEPITHSSRFVLIDKDGRIVGYFDGTEESGLKSLSEAAKALL
jgi:cytochrome oxidase Cu insertion factor (SCO1/SenC/PrrC family)